MAASITAYAATRRLARPVLVSIRARSPLRESKLNANADASPSSGESIFADRPSAIFGCFSTLIRSLASSSHSG